MRNIYIVVSQSGSVISKAIQFATDKDYNHCSFSFDPHISHMYSMGRIYPNNPLIGGLVIEIPNYGTYLKFKNTKCIVIEVPVSEESFLLMQKEILEMTFELGNYRYNVAGLLLGKFGINIERDYYFMCSEFVRHMLESGNIDTSFLPKIPHPMDFFNIPNGRIVYQGDLNQLGQNKNLQSNSGYTTWD